MNEHKAAQLFEELLSGKQEPGADLPEEMLAALNLARRLEFSNPSDASRRGAAVLARLLKQHKAQTRSSARPYLRWSLQGLGALFLAAAAGFLLSRFLPSARPQPTPAPAMAAGAPQAAEPTSPAALVPTLPVVGQPGQPGRFPTPTIQPTSAPLLVVGMQQAVQQLPFPVLAPDNTGMALQLERVEIPAGEEQPNTVTQTYSSAEGEVRITQSEADSGAEEPPPVKAAGEVDVRGQDGYWLELNTGERALFWKEGHTAITISGALPDEQLLRLAEALQPQEPGAQTAIDCEEVFPGLPGCLSQEPLAEGQLAFVDPRPAFSNRPYVANLQNGGGWPAGETPGLALSFSPSSRYLLVRSAKNAYQVYDNQGARVQELPGDLPFDPFWLPNGVLKPDDDWLATPTAAGGLAAQAFPAGQAIPLLPEGTFPVALGARAGAPVVSPDGWIAWTPDPDVLKAAGAGAQTVLVAPLARGEEARSLTLSADISKDGAYRLIDWAPGTRLLLLGGQPEGGSQEAGGLPLYTYNVDSQQLNRLPATMLNTPDAYAWNPVKAGLLVLAEGAGPSIAANKRLALLDLNSGAITYLILNEKSEPWNNFVAFEPQWSPDGRYVAFAALQTQEGAVADSEDALLKRAIWIQDTATAPMTNWMVTPPPDGENGSWIDGWPHWTADGKKLLYTRQQSGRTDVRVRDLSTGADSLLLTGLPDPACLRGGCGWNALLLYSPR